MRDERLLTQLAKAGLSSPKRAWSTGSAALVFAVTVSVALWFQFYAPSRDEAAQALPQVIIASARAQNVDPIDLWDAVGRELGKPMDARQPYFGLNGRDLLRAITLASRDVRPHNSSMYAY